MITLEPSPHSPSALIARYFILDGRPPEHSHAHLYRREPAPSKRQHHFRRVSQGLIVKWNLAIKANWNCNLAKKINCQVDFEVKFYCNCQLEKWSGVGKYDKN